MKKTISLVLIAIMVLSCFIFAIPASALASAADIEYVEALYFETAPTIDGYISEAEWGAPTFDLFADDCVNADDAAQGYRFHEFFYNRISKTSTDDYGSFAAQGWFRWDENKFYIGVKVIDPDVHSNKSSSGNTWNGDAVQVRVDRDGANAAVSGWDFYVDSTMQKPWSTGNVPDFLFGYVEVAGGFSEAWENVSNKGMTVFSKNPLGVTQCVVAPAGSNYSTDTQSGITTYEVAIPWTYIFNGQEGYETLAKKNWLPTTAGDRNAIGREFGVSLAVLNDGCDTTAGWDAFMSWGSGICGNHQTDGAGSATGSNSVTLVDTPVAQGSYTKYDPTSLLDASFSNKNVDAPGVFYDYLAGDTDRTNPVAYDKLSSLKYDDPADLSVWGAAEFQGKTTNIGGKFGNVLDYRDPSIVQTYIDTHDGKVEYKYPASFTFEFDIVYTGTNQGAEGYEPALYNWFGGTRVDIDGYQCGYFFNDNAFKVVSYSDPLQVIASYPYDLKKDNWYNWKFQYDNESCNARLWIDDLSTEADNVENGTAGTPGYTCEWGTLVVNTRWRYFYYSNEDVKTDGTLLIFRQMNTEVAYDNVKIYNFASIGNIAAPDENQGGNNVPVQKPIVDGGNLDLNDANKVDGIWNIPVKVSKYYLVATKLSFTVKVDPAQGSFEGVKGLNEGTYTVEEIGNGEYLITITNFDQVKGLKEGDKFFDILIKSDVDKLADAGVEVIDSYTYMSVSTGDPMVFVVIAAVVAILGCAIVIGKRKSFVR